eukprot:m.8918 g.8918  ORF g.8918 m.8918 type:complete len:1218 (-) comp4118_c0_seq1:210-3863(-)
MADGAFHSRAAGEFCDVDPGDADQDEFDEVIETLKLQQLFDEYASEGDFIEKGTVRTKMATVASALKENSNDEDVEKLLDSVWAIMDDDGDGKVSFTEWRLAFDEQPALMEKIFRPLPDEDGSSCEEDDAALRELFNKYATNGVIQEAVIRERIGMAFESNPQLEKMGHQDSLTTQLFSFLDSDNSGEVDFAEFSNAFQGDMGHAMSMIFDPDPDPAGDARGKPLASNFGPDGQATDAVDELEQWEQEEALIEKEFGNENPKKLEALRTLFEAADDDNSYCIGPEEFFIVLEDDQLGGVLATQMRESMGSTFSTEFVENLLRHLDADKNGRFTKLEFYRAFAPVIDDHGDYRPDQGISGAQLFALQQEYKNLSDEMREREEDFNQTQSQFERRIMDNENEIEVFKSRVVECEKESDAFEAEVKELNGQVAQYADCIAHLCDKLNVDPKAKTRIRDVLDEVELLLTRMTQLHDEVRKLKTQTPEPSNGAAEARIAELEDDLADTTATLKAYTDAIQYLAAQLDIPEPGPTGLGTIIQCVSNLQADLARLKDGGKDDSPRGLSLDSADQIENLEERLRKSEKEVDALRRELETHNTAKINDAADRTTASMRIDNLTKENSKLRKHSKSNQESRDSAITMVESLMSELAAIKAETSASCTMATAREDELNEKLSDLTKALAETSSQLRDASKTVDQLTSTTENEESTIARLHHDLNAARTSNQEQVDRLDTQIASLKNELESARQYSETQIAELESEIQKLRDGLSSTKQENERLAKENSDLERNASQLQCELDEIQKLRDELSSTKQENERRANETRALERNVTQLQSDLAEMTKARDEQIEAANARAGEHRSVQDLKSLMSDMTTAHELQHAQAQAAFARDIDQKNAEIARLTAVISELKGQQGVSSDTERLLSTVDKLQKELRDKDAELAKQASQCADGEHVNRAEIERLASTVDSLRAQLEESRQREIQFQEMLQLAEDRLAEEQKSNAAYAKGHARKLEEELDNALSQLTEEKSKSSAAINACLAEIRELQELLEDKRAELQRQWILEEDLRRSQQQLETAQSRIVVLERAIQTLEEAVLYEREKRQQEECPKDQPPDVSKPKKKRIIHHHVLTLDDMRLGGSALSSTLGLPTTVDVGVSHVKISLKYGNGKRVEWPLDHLREFGYRDGVCTIRFSQKSRHPGTLVFPEPRRARDLFLILRNLLSNPRLSRDTRH